MEMAGKAVLITGGSRGLGKALGETLAEAGARVVLVGRESRAVEEAAADIRRRGGQVHAFAGDLGHKEDIHRIAGAAAALAGPLDVLVNNASTLGPLPLRPLLDTACEDLAQVLEVNLMGPFRLARALVGGMVLRRRGLVLNVSSDASVVGYPNWGAYAVAKAALDHLGRVWAAELAETGVRFLTVDPGEMDTAMHRDAMPEADRSALADPRHVAARILEILRLAEGVPSGARLEAAHFPMPHLSAERVPAKNGVAR